MSKNKKLTRREFVRMGALVGAGVVAAGCAPRVVKETVEKVVKETVLVQGTPQVVEKVVTVAPEPAVPCFSGPQGFGKHVVCRLIPPPKKYSPVVEIEQNTTMVPKFKEGESLNDNVWSRWFGEQMGIHYKFRWQATGDAEQDKQKWNLVLASGDLPEYIVGLDKELFSRLVQAGKLEDITDIWEEQAAPFLKQLKEYPNGVHWRVTTREGRIYGIPYCNSANSSEPLLWLRKDWLDKVGMEVPKTLEELYALAKTFQSEGLCRVGLLVSKELFEQFGSVDPVFGAFGEMPTIWRKGKDGKYVYGSVQPGCKKALAVLQKWYKDGVLDKEFYTIPSTGDKGIATQFSQGVGGIILGSCSIGQQEKEIITKDPSGFLLWDDVPAGPEGKRGRKGYEPFAGAVAFLKGTDPIKIEAVIKHLQWVVDRVEHAMDNGDFYMWGAEFEGYDYVWEGNEVKAGPYPTWNIRGGGEWMAWLYPRYAINGYTPFVASVKRKKPEDWNAMEIYCVGGGQITGAGRDPQSMASEFATNTAATGIANEFVGPPTETMLQAQSRLDKLELETLTKIIIGELEVEDFDKFVEDWTEQGGGKITEEVNAYMSSV
jgi:putative aldouronate transport system substrate-binding protein